MTVKDLRKWLEDVSIDAIIEVREGYSLYEPLDIKRLRAVRVEREDEK
jgi:hypothetical protein